jgi:tetratricopeptide (TPR) repeat protein
MRPVAWIGVAAALGLFVFVGGGIGLLRRLPVDGPIARPAPDAAALLRPASGGDSLSQGIASLQERLRTLPGDWRGFADLGLAYVQQARVTADPSYYPKAQGVLERSLRLQADGNFEAMVGMGALALARHDFSGALGWGDRARALNPYNGNVYGVIGDAQVELGRYRDAFATFQRMVDTRPDLASYARVSYARELQGNVRGALAAMGAAARAAGTPQDAAWASYQLGELYFTSGRIALAEAAYRRGVELAPDYVPPRAGLAKVAWAQGRVHRAIRGYAWVVERFPSPEYVIALGDLYAESGRSRPAGRQYALVRAEERLFRANGVNVDLELAVFDADHGRPVDALAAARAEWGRRHSINVADALAWALYANGRYREAVPYARAALSLGTRNALFRFHAGMIQLRLGHRDAARELLSDALATNPHFSILWGSVARRTLHGLGTHS